MADCRVCVCLCSGILFLYRKLIIIFMHPVSIGESLLGRRVAACRASIYAEPLGWLARGERQEGAWVSARKTHRRTRKGHMSPCLLPRGPDTDLLFHKGFPRERFAAPSRAEGWDICPTLSGFADATGVWIPDPRTYARIRFSRWSACCSIWRTRSRVSPTFPPISFRVFGGSPERPYRSCRMSASRSLN